LTVSTRDALAEGGAQLRSVGIDSARLDARLLLALAMQVAPEALVTDEELRPDAYGRFRQLLARRAAREPLAYISGQKEFWSLSFLVNSRVLIPRPETETLVESALRCIGPETSPRVLDSGTGTGCLLISVLAERPKATGVGVDTSEAALACASTNADGHGVGARCRFEKACWAPAGAGNFDIILVNPPYLSASEFEATEPEIRLWEPRSALVAGEDGLDAIRTLGPVLRGCLAREGKVFVEIGMGQAPAAAEILSSAGLDVHEVIADLSGTPRCLVAGQAGSGG
jgi:release factor glutamine methyltransferase